MADFGNLGFTSNPYLQQQVDSTLGDMTRAWNMTQLPAFNNAMLRSGSFGNSGVDQMTQEAARQFQTSLGRTANDMRSGNFWNGMNFDNQNFWANKNFDNQNYWNNQQFDRNVYNDTFAQNQQNFQNGLNLLGLQNNINQQNLGLGTQIQNAPMNYYQGFANTANSIGQGYGTSTGSMSAPGSPLMGALGGVQLGAKYGPSIAGALGYVNYGGSAGGNPMYPDWGAASGPSGAWT